METLPIVGTADVRLGGWGPAPSDPSSWCIPRGGPNPALPAAWAAPARFVTHLVSGARSEATALC